MPTDAKPEPADEPDAKPMSNRHWYQFSLRALLISTALIGGLLGFGLLLLGALQSIWESPNPEQTFNSHRTAFERVAERLVNDPGAVDADHQTALSELQSAGVTRIRNRGKCIAFYLASLPPDAIYEILYCPAGFRDLPVEEVSGPPNQLLELHRIRPRSSVVLLDRRLTIVSSGPDD